MELIFILKVLFVIGALIALYAVIRNLDIIKIILIYWKDLILESNLTIFLRPILLLDDLEIIIQASDLSISPSFKIRKLFAFKVSPVDVISVIISEEPVKG